MPLLSPHFCLPSSLAAPPRPLPIAPLRRRPTVQWTTALSSRGLLGGSRGDVFCTLSAASGDSGGPRRLFVDGMGAARKVFDELPHPVKSFPWSRLAWNFQGLIVELVVVVAKWLGVPLLALTSLSEMSFCAHERRMGVIPVPFLVGFVLAGLLKDAAVDLSPALKKGGFPWHLFVIACFFVLLKLPGPYYPYWGRLLIPHFANGGLWKMAWLLFLWYRIPSRTSDGTTNFV